MFLFVQRSEHEIFPVCGNGFVKFHFPQNIGCHTHGLWVVHMNLIFVLMELVSYIKFDTGIQSITVLLCYRCQDS